MRRLAAALAAPPAVAVAWGATEATQLRRRTRELPLAHLPPALDGLRILHLSDVHAGYGPGLRLLTASVLWAEELRPDVAVITGDLVARPAGEDAFRRLAMRLADAATFGAYAVLGNHDFAVGNDPFATGRALHSLEGMRLLAEERVDLEVRDHRVCLVGADAYRFLHDHDYDAASPVDVSADLRVLLCHYPEVLDALRPAEFQLVLSGHMHAGQICMPWPTGRIGLAHPRARYVSGIYAREGTVMHVSPGLGTTFLPLRVLARPEATLLVLRSVA